MDIRLIRWASMSLLWTLVVLALWGVWRTRAEAEQQLTATDTQTVWDPQGISDFELIERSGRVVTKEDLLGTTWAVNFVFTQCAGPCPKVSSAMKEVHDRLDGVDVRFVTITVDPKRDDPQTLKQYAEVYGAGDRWWFLTGEQEEIYKLVRDSFKMPVLETTGPDRKPGWEIIHTTNILVVDAEGVVRGKFNSTSDTEMVALRRALMQGAEGKK